MFRCNALPDFASPPRWAGSRRSGWRWLSHCALVAGSRDHAKVHSRNFGFRILRSSQSPGPTQSNVLVYRTEKLRGYACTKNRYVLRTAGTRLWFWVVWNRTGRPTSRVEVTLSVASLFDAVRATSAKAVRCTRTPAEKRLRRLPPTQHRRAGNSSASFRGP